MAAAWAQEIDVAEVPVTGVERKPLPGTRVRVAK